MTNTPMTLWCINIHGPDDIVATPDYITAVRMANLFNKQIEEWKSKSPQVEMDARIWAVPIEYPHSSGHTEKLANTTDDYQWLREQARNVPFLQLDTHATAARLNRLLTVCHGLRWIDVGVLAIDNESTKKALGDLSEILFIDGIDEVVSGKSTSALPFLQEVSLGYSLIPQQPTETMIETMAFNLSSEFGFDFTSENKPFAMAAYKQAWELGIKSDKEPSPRAQKLDSAVVNFAKNLLCSLDPENDLDNPEKFIAWHNLDDAIRALSSQPVADHSSDVSNMVADARQFKLGDRLTKNKGSSWTGHVVGFYSTELTPIGYAIESETEKGSVQIYPEAALRPLPASPGALE